ncbi:MAG: SMP-30/gluconolactonase/LRE family protein [Thermoanaerobaculales bacterium]|jgi:sugar lactone lactonase YvrE|nr:SMP-30/gluconolactonase/LRE family protein [Thermoanaerobaculales bacterium]
MKIGKLTVVVLGVVSSVVACGGPVRIEPTEDSARAANQTGEMRTTLKHYNLGAEAAGNDQNLAARESFLKALETAPEHPALIMRAAAVEAELGNSAAAVAWLERYAALGGIADLAAIEVFGTLREVEGYAVVAAAIAANDRPPAPADIVVTLNDAHLWPEGIAFDRMTGDLFVGSMSENKIVAIRAVGIVEDFGASAGDGLLNVLGMTVDENRRHLWACMGLGSDEFQSDGERRRNGVVRYDLETGRLLARYDLEDDGINRLLNDVIVAADGTAYVTESHHGSVYRIEPGSETIEHFRFFPELNYLNGIELSPDGERLYLAAVEGIFALVLAEDRVVKLGHEEGVSTVSADGLCLAGSSLFAVQNQPRLGFRTMRFDLDDSGLGIESASVLPAGLPEGLIPYTCAAGDGEVFVNGTGPLNLMDTEGVPANPVVIRIPI